MGTRVLSGDPPIEISLRRSARARRMTLRVSGLDGRVTLTLPQRVPEAEGLGFARTREAWLRQALARRPDAAAAGPGTTLPVDGRQRLVVAAAVAAARVEADRIVLRADRPAGPQLAAVLRALARRRIGAAVDRHAAVLGVRPARLTLRDTRSRWGSCSGAGNLMFSWRLILAPADVLDYVAAHEVAHLVRMDHSPAFWSVVADLLPGYHAPRLWLRRNGAELHRWRFGD